MKCASVNFFIHFMDTLHERWVFEGGKEAQRQGELIKYNLSILCTCKSFTSFSVQFF
jgi:hypothetical protein